MFLLETIGAILAFVSKRNNHFLNGSDLMDLAEATRFDMVSVVVNAATENIDAFDYALQTAVHDNASLNIIVWIDDDNLSVFNALNPRYVHKQHDQADKFATDLSDVAKAMGARSVKVSIKRGSNLARLTEEVYCTDFSFDVLVMGSDHHDHTQIRRAVNLANDELEVATVVL
jgi:nucleotide-binding universal stress UspA family protein